MNDTPKKRLSSLKDELVFQEAQPWSNILSWIAKATPILRSDWPEHIDAFRDVAAEPKWIRPRAKMSELRDGIRPKLSPSEIATNNERAEAAKRNIVGFLDGLLVISTNNGIGNNEHNSLAIAEPLIGREGFMRRIGAMIGSPSDAADERQAITDAILRWNAINRGKGLFIEPVKWETHATPGLQGRPQGMINEELVPISDILVAVFRGRAGSPTGKDISGTIEEIREFMQQDKYVVLYFYEGEVSIAKVDPDQLKTINEFRKDIQQHGLTASYKNINELREHIICHLTSIVEKLACSNDLDKAEAKDIQQLLSTMASELISVIILCDEIEQRQINPWLESLRSQFGTSADSLRHMAASDTAIRQSMTTELEELATVLDEAANLRMHSGSWPHFQGLVKTVYDKATAIKQSRIDNVPFSEESLAEIKCTVNIIQRKLTGLAARAEDMMNQGRLDDLQGEPSQYGDTLLRVSYYNIDAIQPSLSEKLRKVGLDLHLIETMRVYCDGGRSVRAIVDRIKKNSDELTSLVEAMNQNEAKRT